MDRLAHQIIGLCWLVFGIYWLFSALTVKAVSERKTFISSLAYKMPAFLGAVLLWDPRLPPPMNFALTSESDGVCLLAVMVCVGGLATALWARWTLAGNWSSNVTFKENHELIQTGPYRFVRHPIYTGILLMSVAVALEYGRLRCWLGVVIWSIAFWIKLKQEESLMKQHFPKEYMDYCRRVKALVPFII